MVCTLQVNRVILSGKTLSCDTGDRCCIVTVDSYHGLEMYVFVCNFSGQPYDCTRKWT